MNEKYIFTVKEISEYYTISTKGLRRIVKYGEKKFVVLSGNKVLIIRHRFEGYLDWCYANNIILAFILQLHQ